MFYFIFAIFGFIGGTICAYFAVEKRLRESRYLEIDVGLRENRLREQSESIRIHQSRLEQGASEIQARQRDIEQRTTALTQAENQFRTRVVSYEELQRENAIVKRDLHNLDTNVRKLNLDREEQRRAQEALDSRSRDLATRYLKDTVKAIGATLSPNNYAASKQRLQTAIEWCRSIGFAIAPTEEEEHLANLKKEYELVVRASFEREEQIRIRARMREELLRVREVERELKRLEREREAIQAALEKALALAHDEHSAEVDLLRKRLAEAVERQRAVSQAQLTKEGDVYVISNIGAFGNGVYKVGLTRRLQPLDRVRELGGASVPFPFDVHMMVHSADAPKLEHELHRRLHKHRVNKANPRKEFFKIELDEIHRIVQENHGEIEYRADPAALEYYQSMTMTDEDHEFIEDVYDSIDEEEVLDDDVN